MLTNPHLRLDEGDHIARFYDGEDDLVGVVVGYLAAALIGGDNVVIIATPEHRAAFEAALVAVGVEPAEHQAEDRLVVLDATETLDRLMVGDRPDRERFDSLVGDVIRRSAATGRPVRAYGEMVAVLCAHGNRDGAIELERLWNDLGRSVPFALFCAYPTDSLADSEDTICALHSHVLSPDGGESRSRVFGGAPQDLGLARRFVCEALVSWGVEGAADDAAVVVSELAANAVSHAKSDFTVSVTRTTSGVRIGVSDRSAVMPVLRSPTAEALGGRGLIMVDRLAERWGQSLTTTGKVVWADLPGLGFRTEES